MNVGHFRHAGFGITYPPAIMNGRGTRLVWPWWPIPHVTLSAPRPVRKSFKFTFQTNWWHLLMWLISISLTSPPPPTSTSPQPYAGCRERDRQETDMQARPCLASILSSCLLFCALFQNSSCCCIFFPRFLLEALWPNSGELLYKQSRDSEPECC